jgi:small subunit ribosomal protein S16
MLKIRFSRGGRKNLPFYRLLVTNSTSPRDSKFLERIGSYNPLLNDDNQQKLVINKERAEYWLSVGAKPSDRVAKFLIQVGVKGAEKYAPNFVAKAKGSNLKKKAADKLAKELAAKAEAEAKAKEESSQATQENNAN